MRGGYSQSVLTVEYYTGGSTSGALPLISGASPVVARGLEKPTSAYLSCVCMFGGEGKEKKIRFARVLIHPPTGVSDQK